MAMKQQNPCEPLADVVALVKRGGVASKASTISLPASLYALGDIAIYVTLGVGLLFAALTASQFTVLGFVVLVAVNLAWLGLYRWLMNASTTPRQRWLGVAALIVVALAGLADLRLGVGLDWLLPITSVAIIALTLSLRESLIIGVVLYALTVSALLLLWGAYDQNTLLTSLTLAPAFVFCYIFTIIMRQQHDQREQAESLVAQLEAAQTQLRAYAAEVEDLSATRERNRMAREIHDTLGHYLTLLAAQLETALKLEERERRHALNEHADRADGQLRAELIEARRVTTECLAEVRRSVAALHPTSAVGGPFDEALRRLVAEAQASQPETALTLDIEGDIAGLSPEVRVALYRCAQEALTNIRKHAHATRALIRLRIETADTSGAAAGEQAASQRVELTILDDGVGVSRDGTDDASEQAPGFGLLGMRERIALLGGGVSAQPSGEHGWRVAVSVPYAASDEAPKRTLTGVGGRA